jgi:hypothetical protein
VKKRGEHRKAPHGGSGAPDLVPAQIRALLMVLSMAR